MSEKSGGFHPVKRVFFTAPFLPGIAKGTKYPENALGAGKEVDAGFVLGRDMDKIDAAVRNLNGRKKKRKKDKQLSDNSAIPERAAVRGLQQRQKEDYRSSCRKQYIVYAGRRVIPIQLKISDKQ